MELVVKATSIVQYLQCSGSPYGAVSGTYAQATAAPTWVLRASWPCDEPV
jgi:hypothetical protein